jgi:hypothetical protein
LQGRCDLADLRQSKDMTRFLAKAVAIALMQISARRRASFYASFRFSRRLVLSGRQRATFKERGPV